MRFLFIISYILLGSLLYGQELYSIDYLRSNHDKTDERQDPIVLITSPQESWLTSRKVLSKEKDYPFEVLYVDRKNDARLFKTTYYSPTRESSMTDSEVWDRYTFTITDQKRQILGYDCTKATATVNSNSIELWFTTDLPVKGSPLDMGQDLGLVLEYVRNGNSRITASRIDILDQRPATLVTVDTTDLLDQLSYQDELWKSRFTQIPVFHNERINFTDNVQSDSVLRFANGTVILKKISIPTLAAGTQGFIELVEKSKGDAYDRTGSVFLIPEDETTSFLDGMKNGMDNLPMYESANGKKYSGMVRTEDYTPILELMRFFTPFGVSHFNDRLDLKGKTWQDSALYRQDITEFVDYMQGKEFYIGTYIGNYDGGGHEISLELTFHPGWSREKKQTEVLPLFNTTNVMEMGGQDYPTMFEDENGLLIHFTLTEAVQDAKLRYITTGHGGWGGGDEFVPKMNTIYLDNLLVHQFVPWRTDCGSFRLYNPVSGNFANGLSSSDLSRSNWCPGSVTGPEFISLGDLEAGDHSLRVHIPQGEPEGNSFSFWNVSGCLLYDVQKD